MSTHPESSSYFPGGPVGLDYSVLAKRSGLYTPDLAGILLPYQADLERWYEMIHWDPETLLDYASKCMGEGRNIFTQTQGTSGGSRGEVARGEADETDLSKRSLALDTLISDMPAAAQSFTTALTKFRRAVYDAQEREGASTRVKGTGDAEKLSVWFETAGGIAGDQAHRTFAALGRMRKRMRDEYEANRGRLR